MEKTTAPKKWKTWHKVFLGFTVFIILLFIIAINSGKKETKQPEAIESAPVNPDSVQKKNTVSASGLLDYYEKNEVKADNAFKDNSFFVKGPIKSISKDFTGDAYLSIGDDDFKSVRCYFKDQNELTELKPGQVVTIKGVGGGFVMGDALIRECTLAKNLK